MNPCKLEDRIQVHLTDLKFKRPTRALSKLNQKQNIDVNFYETIIMCQLTITMN